MSRLTHLRIAGLVALIWVRPGAAQVLQTPPAEPAEPSTEAVPPEEPATEPAAEPTPAQKQERVDALVEETQDEDPFHLKDPKPKTGLGMIIPGWIFLGTAAANLITLPLCRTDAIEQSQQDLCVDLSIGIAIGGAAIGIPLLIAGYNQRADYKAWRQRHPHGWLLNTQFALTRGGAALFYQGAF